MFLLCNEHHRRSLGSFYRKMIGSGKKNDRRNTTPAVAAEETGHDGNVPTTARNDDDNDDTDKAYVVFVPHLDTAVSKPALEQTKSIATVSKHDQEETKSQSWKGTVHETFEKDHKKIDDDAGKNKKNSWKDRRGVNNKGLKPKLKPKRVALEQVEWDVSNKSSGIVTATTYTEGTTTHATTSTRTSRDDNCVGATVEELGAVVFNVWPAQAKAKAHKGGIPAVIRIRPEPVVMTIDSPIGCFNPVQTAMEVSAAIELVTSQTFSNHHRQLQNVRRTSNLNSRKRELQSHHSRIEIGNFYFSVGTLSTSSTGLIYPLQTVEEDSIAVEASQSYSFDTKQRQLQEARRAHNRKRELRIPASGSGLAKQCAVIGVDHSKVSRANAYQRRGRQTCPASGSIAPFSAQCAVLEATKSMSEESNDDYVFSGNPHYLDTKGSVSAESRYRS